MGWTLVEVADFQNPAAAVPETATIHVPSQDGVDYRHWERNSSLFAGKKPDGSATLDSLSLAGLI
jgi:hypothetical protein